MKEVKEKVIESFSDKDTYNLGLEMGRTANEGDFISLVGDLGVGKTVFTKGFARGLEIEEEISSPTFTILQSYDEGRLPFYHFDVYRIGSLDELDEIGYYEYVDGEGVCMVEWANLFPEMMPKNYTEVTIEKDVTKGFDYRRIRICEY